MKINGNIEAVYKAYRTDKIEKKDLKETKDVKDGAQKSEIKDVVTISSDARIDTRKFEVDFAKRKLGSSSDVRQDKIDAIKAQIKEGTYNVRMEDVAQSIMDRLI